MGRAVYSWVELLELFGNGWSCLGHQFFSNFHLLREKIPHYLSSSVKIRHFLPFFGKYGIFTVVFCGGPYYTVLKTVFKNLSRDFESP